jgi:2-dehydro-3-deoxy-D-arabinonate dehydratase
MTRALFRLALADGSTRLALGDPSGGPSALLDPAVTLDGLLAADGFWDRVAAEASTGGIPAGWRLRAPIERQPVWAAGVTYERSKAGREQESTSAADVYGLVYEADRPELFFKGDGPWVVGPDEAIGVRRDSTWDAPEPELVLVVDAALRLVGYTVGNDVSSRSIEGANPLYLPQAKVYERSCALGPCIVAADDVRLPADVSLSVLRDGAVAFSGTATTGSMRRTPAELIDWLGRAMAFERGAFLMTGTGIVPPETFTLRPADVVTIAIAGMGELRNPVAAVGRA